ncbi:MAG: hypothetical protein HFI45_17745 [Lachnospiraceae bacterium]|nr:hypothetical protein [Lachnospiraceae bacterium]
MTLTKDDLQAISHLFDDKFESIDKRFESIDKRFESIDKRFESIDKRFESINGRLDIMELKIDRNARNLEKLQFEVKAFKISTQKSIHILQDEMETVIEILKQNEMLPQ